MFKRSMFQLYLAGCDEAMGMYTEAFGGTILVVERHPQDKTIVHAKMDIYGQIVALSERTEPTVIGNTTQLCLNFTLDDEDTVKKANQVLKEGADINHPLEQGTEIPRGSGAGFSLVARSRSAGVAAPRQTESDAVHRRKDRPSTRGISVDCSRPILL